MQSQVFRANPYQAQSGWHSAIREEVADDAISERVTNTLIHRKASGTCAVHAWCGWLVLDRKLYFVQFDLSLNPLQELVQ